MLIAQRFDEGKFNELEVKPVDFVPQEEVCIVRHINPDGSFRVQFTTRDDEIYHDQFCEAWLRKLTGIFFLYTCIWLFVCK